MSATHGRYRKDCLKPRNHASLKNINQTVLVGYLNTGIKILKMQYLGPPYDFLQDVKNTYHLLGDKQLILSDVRHLQCDT